MSNSTGQASPGLRPEAAADPSAADPSMEDILASIRRILSEDETSGPGESEARAATPLVLDATMLVREPQQAPSIAPVSPLSALSSIGAPGTEAKPSQVAPHPAPVPTAAPLSAAPPPIAESAVESHVGASNVTASAPPVSPPPIPQPAPSGLVAPEVAAAASASIDTLVQALTAERQSAIYRGGPTIEDLVREQIRPILKQWLDTHLPPLVERLVRSEIERVVGRAVS